MKPDFERFLDVRDSDQVDTPSMIELDVTGPGGANHLAIFTGTALVEVAFDEDDEIVRRGPIHINLNYPVRPGTRLVRSPTVVGLASLFNKDDEDTIFGVDRASTDAHDTSRFPRPPHGVGLVLNADLALQGGDSGIHRIAYQAHILLHVSAVELEAVLINSIGGPIGTTATVGSGSDWEIRAKLTEPAPNPGVIVVLTSDHGELAPVPVSLFVPAGQDTSIVARPHTGRNFTSRLVDVVLTGSYRAVRTATLTIEVAPK
jgi:hypothetical protein